MVSKTTNEIYPYAFQEFISEISKVWTKDKNTDIAITYGLDKNILPSLVALTRQWDTSFNSLSNDCDELQKENQKLVSRIEDFNNTDLFQENQSLKEKIQVLKNEIYDNEVTIERLNTHIDNLEYSQPRGIISILRGNQ